MLTAARPEPVTCIKGVSNHFRSSRTNISYRCVAMSKTMRFAPIWSRQRKSGGGIVYGGGNSAMQSSRNSSPTGRSLDHNNGSRASTGPRRLRKLTPSGSAFVAAGRMEVRNGCDVRRKNSDLKPACGHADSREKVPDPNGTVVNVNTNLPTVKQRYRSIASDVAPSCMICPAQQNTRSSKRR